jgi:hypothetical protein
MLPAQTSKGRQEAAKDNKAGTCQTKSSYSKSYEIVCRHDARIGKMRRDSHLANTSHFQGSWLSLGGSNAEKRTASSFLPSRACYQ